MDLAKIRMLMDAGLTDDQIRSLMDPGTAEAPTPEPEQELEPMPETAPEISGPSMEEVSALIASEFKKINERIDKLNLRAAGQPSGSGSMTADEITKMLIGGK